MEPVTITQFESGSKTDDGTAVRASLEIGEPSRPDAIVSLGIGAEVAGRWQGAGIQLDPEEAEIAYREIGARLGH